MSYTVYFSILDHKYTVSFYNGTVFLANEKIQFIHWMVKELTLSVPRAKPWAFVDRSRLDSTECAVRSWIYALSLRNQTYVLDSFRPYLQLLKEVRFTYHALSGTERVQSIKQNFIFVPVERAYADNSLYSLEWCNLSMREKKTVECGGNASNQNFLKKSFSKVV